MIKIFTALAFLIGIVNTPAQALTFPEKPPAENFFVDEAGLIQPEQAREINGIASGLLRELRVPMLVVTIPSLISHDAATLTIEQYARALFDSWQIGFTDRNYGILLVVSKGDRKARIELGGAWAGAKDVEAQRVMNDLIIPQFKSGAFSVGILDGVRGMEALARGLNLPAPTRPWWFIPVLIGIVVFVAGIAVSLFKSGKTGWAWAFLALVGGILFFLVRNAGKSGSKGSYGGGSGGGGGASGSW